ncbi:adenosine receptor A2a-like [Culicoides brevitarsis]|uniref:adenosine receptor A2a-like n=1 Tax=Culicoides brevitarsis TaxID=469753 RepID=UPI00307BB70B
MDRITLPRNASYVKESDFPYVITSIAFGILSVLTNLIVLVAFYVKKGKQTTIRSYVISMAIADVLYGAVSVPLAILSSVGLPYRQREWCLLSTGFQIMTVGFTIMALLSTVEMQFIGVMFPIFFQMKWTSQVVRCHIASHWIMGFLFGSPIILGNNLDDDTCYFLEIVPKNVTLLVTFGMVVPAASVMILCYVAIYIRFIKAMTHRFTTLGVVPDKKPSSNMKSFHVKTSAVIFLNVLLFLVCWLPLYILDTINVFDETFTANVHIINALLVLRCVRCATNPLLYAYHIPEVKTSIYDIHRWLLLRCNIGDAIKRDRSISQQTIVTKL